MIDFAVFVKALNQGTPWAILIAAIGAIWQLIYIYSRDRATERNAKRAYDLEQAKFLNQKTIEEKKFEYQKALENLRCGYEERKWREQLALQLASKHVDARLSEYADLWSEVRIVARHNKTDGALTVDSAKAAAAAVEKWRYSRGGLLAEETTRDAALALQTALWSYNGTNAVFAQARSARRWLRAALRADMGLGEDGLGHSIFDATAARHKIAEELSVLKQQLGISNSNVG